MATTGSRYVDYRKKRKYEIARQPTLTTIGNKKSVSVRARSNHVKFRILKTNTANIYDPKTKTYLQAIIKTILENPANRHFVRRNIMTKGTIIETDKGKAKIVNRPGQENTINAILI